jgi:hypothetical protein
MPQIEVNQRCFSPEKCAAYSETGVRHGPFSVCALLRFHCATCPGLCTLWDEGFAMATDEAILFALELGEDHLL